MDLVRAGDRERYLCVLFAPEDKRPALAALHAFDLETKRISDLVSEPMPGEIRLQWWREVVSGERDGEARQHPVGAALLEAIERFRLSRTALVNLTEARIFDLYNDPMPDRAALEGYLGETVSSIFQLSAQILAGGDDPQSADVAGHGGVAYGISGLLKNLPVDRRQGRVFIPADILAAAGTDPEGFLSGEDRAGIERAIGILVDLGRDHLAKAEMRSAALDKRLRPAFLPLSLCEPVFRKAQRARARAWERPPVLAPLTTLLRLFSSSIRG